MRVDPIASRFRREIRSNARVIEVLQRKYPRFKAALKRNRMQAANETIDRQSLPRIELSTVRVVIYRYRRPSRDSPLLLSVNPAWSCDILISLQRAIELHRDARIDKGEKKTGRHERDR